MGWLFSRGDPRSVEELEVFFRKMPAWLRNRLFHQATLLQYPHGGLPQVLQEADEEARVQAQVEILARYVRAWGLGEGPGKKGDDPRPDWLGAPGDTAPSTQTQILIADGMLREAALLLEQVQGK